MNKFISGTYKADSKGKDGDIKVSVTFSSNKIENIHIDSEQETAGISDIALRKTPKDILDNQSLGVDAIAGASITSNAILDAVKDCAKQAGANVEALQSVPVVKHGKERNISTDLVIVGAGVAGISAALQAVEDGISNIILIDHSSALGGEAYYSGGIIQATGANAQKERGLTNDTPKDLAKYWNDMADNKVNTDLVNEVAEKSGDSVNWIEKMGVKFADNLTKQGEATVARALTSAGEVGGRGLMQPMIDQLKTTNVKTLLETHVVDVLQDDDHAAQGVKAVDLNTDDEYIISAKAVIFANNNDQGMDLVQKTNADFRVHDVGYSGTIFGNDGLYLNQKGERFTNESGFYERVFKDLRDTNAGNFSAYMIVDSGNLQNNQKVYHQADGSGQTWKTLVENSKDPDFRYSGLDAGETFEGNTLEEALKAAKIPVAEATKAIQRYNELCNKGVDEDFDKSPENLQAIGNQAPFYVWRVPLYSVTAPDKVGTPKVNIDCQMLHNGKPMKGFYATGTLLRNEFKYEVYAGSGTYIQMCLSTGRIAADSVAKNLQL